MWKLMLMAAIVVGATPAAAQSVKAGVEAWQRTDYPAAVAIWKPLAEGGNADAAFNLGQAYRLGRGVPLDLSVAHSWFERAARKGHLDAQTTLGLLLFDGGSRPDGLRWLKTAAERGEPRALLIYGTALFNGDGVPEDRVLAYAYISRSAAQGLGPAKGTLVELDRILPLETRQKGVAIAQAEAASGKTAPVKAAAKAAPKPASKAAAKPASAPPPAAAKGNWRVQLGAFAKRSSAEALFAKLSGRAALAGRQPFLIPAGNVTRLQAGPFENRQAAAAACAALSAGGQACFPVPAK